MYKFIHLIMENHMYSVGEETRLQATGGPAGLRITGTISKATMNEWWHIMKDRCETARILVFLFSKYVDDVTTALTSFSKDESWNTTTHKI